MNYSDDTAPHHVNPTGFTHWSSGPGNLTFDPSCPRCWFDEANRLQALIAESEGVVAKLSKAICPDGSITDTQELVEWADELQYAMSKLTAVAETETALLAGIAKLEVALSQAQAALRWTLESIRPWRNEEWFKDGKSSNRRWCRFCDEYERAVDGTPNEHADTCPYDAAQKVAFPLEGGGVTP